MPKRINTNNRGFTIIEIIVVLVLISIIAATTFQRSISTDQINFRSQFDKIQNQVRYPQSMAMKRSEWWGFSCDTNTNTYWIFSATTQTATPIQRFLPGQQEISILLSDLGITMDGFTVIFDPYGRPYSPDVNTPLSAGLVVDLTDSGSESRSFTIVPETGLIR
ncbi:MAG: type II secretion system protein [Desulfobacteraceae bacterium]|jgi:MSHA pilin protein MshC|nr:type II secretion system protein [Desulfobacteraceae bacterium]